MTKTIQEIENNSQTEYFKLSPNKEQENEEENKVFDLVLVDINKTNNELKIECVKKNMYDPKLKYICISYRWGELNEQQLETPDYTAHIISFDLVYLEILCSRIRYDPDLCEINYLWIDAISVDQQNYSRKKDTILKMNQIYQHATYILAVPDLHLDYLLKHPENRKIINLIRYKYKETIYNEIFNSERSDTYTTSNDINSSISANSTSQNDSISEKLINNDDQYSFVQKLINENKKLKTEIKELKIENKKLKTENINKKIKEDRIRIYQFLAYLIDDWSNRAWVISEYQIAKDKYKKSETPLKYIFYSLLDFTVNKPFFSYYFNEDDDQQSTINNKVLTLKEVIDSILFNKFVKSRFMQRSHLDMMLNSNATKNEDRFNAILPSWNKYKHVIINKNTISDWNITDMTSVRLKLYEIMDDLWDKALLLYSCREGTILPTFASNYNMNALKIIEKLNYNNVAYKQFETFLLDYISNYVNKEESIKIKQLIDEYKINSKSIWNENLTNIQFELRHCYLSVKPKKYIIINSNLRDKYKYQSKLSSDDDDEIHSVFIPYFTSNLPAYIDYLPIYTFSSNIYLIGDKKKNKWVLNYDSLSDYESEHFCTDDYTFNIY